MGVLPWAANPMLEAKEEFPLLPTTFHTPLSMFRSPVCVGSYTEAEAESAAKSPTLAIKNSLPVKSLSELPHRNTRATGNG